MSDTYRHKNIAKARNGIVSWKVMVGHTRNCTCEYCSNNRKWFDTKKRKAAEQDLVNYEQGQD